MSELLYHLRITIKSEDEAEGVVSNFYQKFDACITKCIFSYEFKEYKGVKSNHHIHGHIQYNTKFKLANVQYYLKTKHPALYNHTPLRKEPEHNERYVCKECRLIRHTGYTEERINEIKQENIAIEEDKAKDPKQKLIEKLKQKHGNLIKFTMNQLLEEIKTVYIIDWDKFPPPQCKALCEYITVKEVHAYTEKPRTKKNDFGDDILLVPPLAKSWTTHCESQFRDNQNPDNLDWNEDLELDTPPETGI